MKENKGISSRLLTAFVVVLFVIPILISGCNTDGTGETTQEPSDFTQATPTPSAMPTPEPAPAPYDTEASLIAVGDIMMHSPQIPAGYDAATKTYNYDAFFKEVKDILATGDWVAGNLETPIAGVDLGYTGYPEFNAPPELADALKNAGFNIITTANNHALDRREKGVLRTLKNLHARGLVTKGTASSPEEAEQLALVTKHEISMAFLAYTYGTNGIPIPEGKDYLVSLIDEPRMIADIKKAKETGADLVTIAIHYGYEYHTKPNDFQKTITRHLIEAGADIILGSHPHVVQPYEFIEVQDAAGHTRKGVVIYSLGNFISNQDRSRTQKPTDIGVIFKVNVRKHFPDQTVEITGVEAMPTYVHQYKANGKRNYRVLPLESVVTLKNDPLLGEKDYARFEGYLEAMNQHLASLALPVQGK